MSLVCVAMLRSSSVTLLQEENKLFFCYAASILEEQNTKVQLRHVRKQ